MGRFEKLEERVRDVEARLARAEAMVNQHAAHAAPAPQTGGQGKQQGSKGPGMGGMMDDGMMGMPDPATPGQGQPNPPPAGGGMGGGMGGMGGHM